jgi:hypothetical protein
MRIREQLVTNEDLQRFYMGFTISIWWQMKAYNCIIWAIMIICWLMRKGACVFVSINGHLWNHEHCKYVNTISDIQGVYILISTYYWWFLHMQVIKMTINVVTMEENGLYGHFIILKSNKHMHTNCFTTNGVYGGLETICGWNALR